MAARSNYDQAKSPALCAGSTTMILSEMSALFFRKGCSSRPEYLIRTLRRSLGILAAHNVFQSDYDKTKGGRFAPVTKKNKKTYTLNLTNPHRMAKSLSIPSSCRACPHHRCISSCLRALIIDAYSLATHLFITDTSPHLPSCLLIRQKLK